MASNITILISGANRGLGKAFVQHYLALPNRTVIGTVRDTQSDSANQLRALPAAEGSRIILVKIEYTSPTDAFDAVKELEAQGVTKLDKVIANAGVAGQQGPMGTIDAKGLAEVYLINAVGPAVLFLALKPLLDKAESPAWISLSTALASLNDIEKYAAFKGFPYNSSKAALNHFTKTIHVEQPNITAFVVHPGFLETDMGRTSAAFFGVDKSAFTDLSISIKGITGLLDNATKENYSGKFLSFNGDEMAW